MVAPFTPDWVKNAVFYQIFPDRFAKSEQVYKPANLEAWSALPTHNGFKGGDLLGVHEKLDYLQDLGITAIYFNPIFQSACNHRYHTHDYYLVDPLLGGNAAFEKLLKEAHRRHIKIVLDGVFNHASRGFFQFNHILECGGQSPYLDWFNVRSFPLNAYHGKPNFDCWWGMPALPKFNIKNADVRRYLMDVARYWIDFGIDGWRLDVPFEITEEGFWEEFREVVKSGNPEAYIVGEVPWEATEWMQGDKFDAVMNYQLTAACVSFFGNKNLDIDVANGMMGINDIAPIDAGTFASRAMRLQEIYAREFAQAQLNLLGSHDMPRFLTMCKGHKESLLLAYLFVMTYPGAPCIFYGDEIGLSGGKEPLCRQGFNWDESQWDQEIRQPLKKFIQIRQENPALRTGEIHFIHAEDDVIAYMRRLGDECYVVALNNSANTVELNIPMARQAYNTPCKDLLGGESALLQDNFLRIPQLNPFSGAIFTHKVDPEMVRFY